MQKLFTVNITSSPKIPANGLIVSPDIHTSQDLRPGQKINLCFGSEYKTVQYLGTHKSLNPNSIFISEQTKQELLMPAPITLNMTVNDDIWKIGPVIGIFANKFKKKERPFGEQTGYFRKLGYSAYDLNCFCIVFSPEDIDWKNKTINGMMPPSAEASITDWKNITSPFPDVIYDRGLFPRGDKRKAATEVRKILRNYPGVKFFNPAFFGKWNTHKLLSQHEELLLHLPETCLYKNFVDITRLLNRHSCIYLKPTGGSSGSGIIRVSLTNSGYDVCLRTGKKIRTVKIKGSAELNQFLKQQIGKKRYIVQQGLNLAKANGAPFDVRVLMQKNRHGKWLRTGIAARIASPGYFISNIHAGGHAQSISHALLQAFSQIDTTTKIINDIRRICTLTASWVSLQGNPLFGEIAIDLGVDEEGKVWIIELNAIPGRTVFRKIGADNISLRAIKRPIEYAYYLAGFSPSANEK